MLIIFSIGFLWFRSQDKNRVSEEAYDLSISLYNSAIERKNEGDVEEAIALNDKAITLNPDLYQAYVNNASIYMKQGQFEKAIDAVRQGLSVNPKDSVGWTVLSASYAKLGRFEESLKASQHCLEVGLFSDCFLERGHTYDLMTNYRASYDAFAEGLRHFPDNESLLGNVVLMSLKRLDLESSEMHFAQLKATYPDHNNLVLYEKTLIALREHVKAEASKATATNPRSSDAAKAHAR